MWRFKKIEPTLFRWGKWRCSLIREWIKSEKYYQIPPDELNLLAKSKMERLALESIGFTFYWACCLTSDCNLDYEASFAKIIVPPWWTPEFNRAFSVYALPGQRVFPPNLTNERDRNFFHRQYGMTPFSDGRGYVFLSSSHELNVVLDELKGRPRKRGRVGRGLIYSDRLAVRCAALRKFKNSPLQISKLVDLPEEVYLEGREPDVVRQLLNRGNRLIMEFELSPISREAVDKNHRY
ncbi:hypothetical protein ACFLX4_00505 [Chloroflexota bacterium]